MSCSTKVARGLDRQPVSLGQRGFLFTHEFFADEQVLNVGLRLSVRGELDLAALQRALDHLVERHEQLRAVFVDDGDGPACLVAERAEQPLRLVDLRDLAPAPAAEQLEQLVRSEIRQRFDLSRLPLLRVTVIRRAAAETVVLLVFNHVIADGTAFFAIYLEELETLYNAYCAGDAPQLPPEAASYRAFVDWQLSRNQGASLTRKLGFWSEQLQGAPGSIDLPAQGTRLVTPSGRGHRVELAPLFGIVQAVDAYAKANNIWSSSVLLAAFYMVLARYARQDDLVVGVPLANRLRKEFQRTFGTLINTVPLRARLADDETFAQLAKRVHVSGIQAMMNGDVAFEKIVEHLKVPSDPSRSAIHQIVFNYTPYQARSLTLGGVEVTVERIFPDATFLDMIVEVSTPPEGLLLAAEVNSDVHSVPMVQALLGHYGEIVRQAVARPEVPIGQLSMLPEPERERLLVEWNATERERDRTLTLHGLIERQIDRTPDATAIICGEASLSYGELERRANRLAHHLRRAGVGSGSLVGISLERSPQMVVGLLAILKTGACYVPLDADYPDDRLAFMIEDSKLALIVTEQRIAPTLPAGDVPLVCVDREADAIAACPDDRLSAGAVEDRAYVIYTSGSTGRPKGVVLPHRAVANFLTTMADRPGLDADDTLVAVTTLSFDIAVLELYLPLSVGARVAIASREDAADGATLGALLAASGATVMQATPATWRLLVAADWRPPAGFRALCGGEAFPADLARELRARVDHVWNMYGPTETTVWSTCCELTDDGPISIGRPIGNTQVYLLDRNLAPVPVGVAGELHIGGEGVALGYLDRPELTAERFIDDPFRAAPGARLYKTGDLVRQRDDGMIEYLNRLDQQVKVRGYRIELGEIEAAAATHPRVAKAVVGVYEPRAGDTRLVAYLVLVGGGGGELALAELRAHLAASLPQYMLPQHLVILDDLPLTPAGKVDRKSLPAPEEASSASAHAYFAPRSGIEQALARIWSEELGVERVGLLDGFFELGGHSLLATRVVARIRSELSVQLPVRVMFDAPTVELLARRVGHERGEQQPQLESLAEQNAPVTTLFHFGAADARLLGAYTVPAGGAGRAAVLLCYPTGQEYMRCHWTYGQLAGRLAKAGLSSLRFDYFATGDSAGESAAGRADIWVEDIARAAQELARRAALSSISIVGLRFGANLAAAACNRIAGAPAVDRLVLCDPLPDGGAYLRELDAMHREFCRDPMRFSKFTPEAADCPDERVGYPHDQQMRAAYERFAFEGADPPGCRRADLVVTERPWIGRQVQGALGRAGCRCEQRDVGAPARWTSVADIDEALIAPELLSAIVELCGERADA